MEKLPMRIGIVASYGYTSKYRTADDQVDLIIQNQGYESYLNAVALYASAAELGALSTSEQALPDRALSAGESVAEALTEINRRLHLNPALILADSRARSAQEGIFYAYHTLLDHGIKPDKGSLIFCDTRRLLKMRVLRYLVLPFAVARSFSVVAFAREDTGPSTQPGYPFRTTWEAIRTWPKWRKELVA